MIFAWVATYLQLQWPITCKVGLGTLDCFVEAGV